jgi:hypothetical protein
MLGNGRFFKEAARRTKFRAGIARAVELGWLWRHESGTYVKSTAAGACAR